LSVDLGSGDGADKRAYRLKRIRDIINDSGGINILTVLGFCEVALGLKEKTAKNYVKTLTKYGIIYRRGDKLFVKKS
jgi:hypothetical protein